MNSDYHDVPHCIRQALAATSPAPTHYSRVSESPSHDEVMIAQMLSPAGVVGDPASTTTAAAAAESQTAASSFQGFGQTVLGEGPEVLYRRLREVQDANGVVARQIDEMRGLSYSVPNISGFKEVRTSLDQCARELERRTHLLANGVIAATDGVEAIRAGVMQLEQMVGSNATDASNGLQKLARENEELRAQVMILHNRLEQLTADSKTSLSSLDKRIADLEGKDLIQDASLETIRQQSHVLESFGSSGEITESNEAVISTLNAIREEQGQATRKMMALERVTQKFKGHDAKISAELEHVLRSEDGGGNAAPLEGAQPKSRAQKVVQFQDEEIKSPRPSSQPQAFSIGTPDTGLSSGGQIQGPSNLGWWDEPPGWSPLLHCHKNILRQRAAALQRTATGSFSSNFLR